MSIINFIKTHAIGTLYCFVLGQPCTFHICCVRAALAVTGETWNTWVRVVFSLRCKLSPVIRALIRNTAKSDTSNTWTVGKIERFSWTIYLMCNVFPFSQRKVLSLSLHWITTLPPWKLESANSACTRDWRWEIGGKCTKQINIIKQENKLCAWSSLDTCRAVKPAWK